MPTIKITDATVEPLTLQEAKIHLNETLADAGNDAYISALITVARQAAEDRLGRTLIQTTLQRVIEARAQVQTAREAQDIGALGNAEGALRAGLGRLFAVAEAYPELKSNEHFMQLQQRISSLENGIADRRELYNEAVNLNNVRIEQFPDAFIARAFGFDEKPLLEFSQAEKADVDLKQLFG